MCQQNHWHKPERPLQGWLGSGSSLSANMRPAPTPAWPPSPPSILPPTPPLGPPGTSRSGPACLSHSGDSLPPAQLPGLAERGLGLRPTPMSSPIPAAREPTLTRALQAPWRCACRFCVWSVLNEVHCCSCAGADPRRARGTLQPHLHCARMQHRPSALPPWRSSGLRLSQILSQRADMTVQREVLLRPPAGSSPREGRSTSNAGSSHLQGAG